MGTGDGVIAPGPRPVLAAAAPGRRFRGPLLAGTCGRSPGQGLAAAPPPGPAGGGAVPRDAVS
jgi:hypothetical protein